MAKVERSLYIAWDGEMKIPHYNRDISDRSVLYIRVGCNSFMKTFSYNRLKNARIKSISLGFVGIILNALLIFFFYLRLMNNQKDNIFQIVILSFVIMGLVILIGYMPFGQVVEKIDNKTLITYFELGPFKWGVRKYESPGKMTIVQDEKKYYCLIIGHSQDQKLILERYPTLDRAEERMIEFGKIFEPE